MEGRRENGGEELSEKGLKSRMKKDEERRYEARKNYGNINESLEKNIINCTDHELIKYEHLKLH